MSMLWVFQALYYTTIKLINIDSDSSDQRSIPQSSVWSSIRMSMIVTDMSRMYNMPVNKVLF
jgi:hypothetical protein